MTTYFISRHQGALEWIKKQGITVDLCLSHIEPEQIKKGDTILGTLPINIVAMINQQGANYLHLSLQLPADKRGQELTVQEMEQYQAKLEAYEVIKKS